MSAPTSISWTDYSWNPVSGCTKVSAGCDNCYAESIATRFAGTPAYPNGFAVTLKPERLADPLRKRSWRGKKVFVNSMSDLFHKDVPDEYVASVFAVMAAARETTFQVLTKRPARMRALLSSGQFRLQVGVEYVWGEHVPDSAPGRIAWPLPNVWLGISVEDQAAADLRIPLLLDTPAAVRFLSCEPLLGPVDLRDHVDRWTEDDLGTCDWGNCNSASVALRRDYAHDPTDVHMLSVCAAHRGIDWVIVGGESGPGARPMHPEWVRSLRDQCVAAGVPFHFKQRGEWTWNEPGAFRMPTKPLSDRVAVMHPAGMTAMTKTNPFDPFERGRPNWATRIERVGKKAAGRELDGRTWDEFPVGAS